ncbi:helix-turn-helix transcriptional regulator [Mycobacterium sp. RTGN5]|uniref:helix-turn-helix domain-containing protein n=1 Tax=Mycobacterium sp. RTGN5 TaxID=3016522 RepID=UPI0029C87ECA|nr:helix-turn-helix transcriptional regulator [Mycobacterium sp. RTGN5]
MGTHAVQRGPTAETVAANIKRLREGQNLGLRALAARLADAGRPLPHTALDKIERGTRRVDVDDLMAIAVALEVSPATLLMPEVTTTEWDDSEVETTGLPKGTTAELLWGWLTAQVHPTKHLASWVTSPMWVARSVPPPALRFEISTPSTKQGN